MLEIFIRNLLKACPDICRGELMLHLLAFFEQDLGECGRFLEIDLELLLPAMGADTLLFDIFFREDIPCQVILSPHNLLDLFRRKEQLAATPAGHTEKFSYHPCIPDMNYGLGEQ